MGDEHFAFDRVFYFQYFFWIIWGVKWKECKRKEQKSEDGFE